MQEQFQFISTQGLDPLAELHAQRLNCLGSLYYFIKVGLNRTKLTPSLHYPLCRSLEKSRIKDVIEFPRDHYKTTICSEGLPMWWALPLTQRDIDAFKALGYSDEFVRFMMRVHNPATRTILTSENDTNAKKIGSRVDSHFKSNARYRNLFPETLPTSAEIWTAGSMHVHIPNGSPNGEGTFDYIGVGGALQSRHYDRSVQDDLVGRKSIESDSVMDKVIDYHRLLPGAFESDDAKHDNDELIIGNRWGFNDLNSYVREEEPWFRIESHSALGGCCALHPAGRPCTITINGRAIDLPGDRPIFPESFSLEKLATRRKGLGPYYFSCQFLNNPTPPDDTDFKSDWLREFTTYVNANHQTQIRHQVYDGIILKDEPVSFLERAMAVDPNHSGNAAHGRCRHAIVVVGLSTEGNYYLLDYWAKHAGYDLFFDECFAMARRWKIHDVGFETVAAQKYAAYHIQTRNAKTDWPIKIIPLRGEVDNPDGTTSRKKDWRIRNVLEPIFASNSFWCRATAEDFKAEYKTFPTGKLKDILDALAYVPQLLHHQMPYELHMRLLAQNRASAAKLNRPYAIA